MKNSNPLVLTIDFGTQSLRAALINKQGEIEAISKRKYDPCYLTPTPGSAEQDADFYIQMLVDSLKELTSKNKDKLDRILAATVSTFRDTAVLLDENNKPIRRCILWLDQRMAKASEKIPTLHKIIFQVVGMGETIKLNRKRTVAHWVKENEPENWAKVKKYVNISTYITFKLTGKLVDSSAAYAGHYPIDFKHRVWWKKGALKGDIFGISPSMLCELKQPGDLLGTISDDFAKEVGLPSGINLIATGSDKACETIGVGALNRDTAAISFGTACSVEVSNQKYYEPEPFLPPYPAAVKDWYNMDVQIYRGYWMISWFSENFANELLDLAKIEKMAIEKVLDKDLLTIPPGSDGLVLQPYWCPGLRRPLAKGGVIGWSDIHTRAHLYKAIIEGISYALREGLEGIEKSQHHKVREIIASGGGSQSDAVCQITADIFGLPVSRVQTFETTSLGAAISTFAALKEFPNVEEAMKVMSRKSITFKPNMENHEKYNELYEKVYLKMFPKLKSVYKDMNKLTHRAD